MGRQLGWDRYLVRRGTAIRLDQLPTAETSLCPDKKEARKLLKQYVREIDELLDTFAVEEKRSLLVVLQGMDASGKDGAIRKVFTGVNPLHCRATSFKEPDAVEKAHDYLWRIYAVLPARGQLGIFNRSHYEDVVVAAAREKHSPQLIRMRLQEIADIERIWAENGTVIRKFFLHVSPEEQKRRLQERLDNPGKHWKLDESDFADRRHWNRFQKIYEHALSRTSTADAPWYIIPADRKWYRNIAIAAIVRSTLQELRPRLPHPHIDRSRFRL
ncbi:MAG TPA: PPK2 family polyphosphate kinase [Acidobacteriaceae bacterium]|nr:PPK2 family polyphosphate kinase [Acidobacteriaceae bacterium]